MSPWFTTLVMLSGIATADLPVKPDIVVLLADDLGQLDITPYGGRGLRTPQGQQLADSGLTFERAYVASPSCAPSRAALLTGLMPARKMNIYPIRSVRHGDWKYIRNVHPEFQFTTHIDQAKPVDGNAYWQDWVRQGATSPAAAAIVEKYHRRPAEELYDLSRDPEEQQNLAADPQHAARLAALRSDLDAWLAAQGDKLTVFNEPRR
jgi:arylsulfatase A-like enzyme